MSGAVHCLIDGPLARVTLDHPDRLNAMSRAMWPALQATFEELGQRADLRCVVLRGAAGQFCAGGDISEYPDFRFDRERLRDFHEHEVWAALQSLLDCDVPLIAVIEGACMGAGMEIASCCDLRLAADNARFGAPIARLGFPMAPREARLVAWAAGELSAREMLLAAASLDAHEMRLRGFLNRVLDTAALDAEVKITTARICTLAPHAARHNKLNLRRMRERQWAAMDAGGGAWMDDAYAYAPSPEHREGIQAFLDKRPPAF